MIRDFLEAAVLACFAWGGFFVLGGSVFVHATGEAAGYVFFGSGLAMMSAGWILHGAAKRRLPEKV